MAKIYSSLILFLALCVFPAISFAAVLRITPASESYTTGGTFTASVYVDSASQAMNAAAATVSFPKDVLEVVSISKSGSIFSLWPEEPSFSNSSGTVSFEGIVLNPGYTGTGGKLLAITFKVRSAGSAYVGFGDATVLANDGLGTSILSSTQGASYTASGAKVQSEPIPPTSSNPAPSTTAPKGPAITSGTHPDELAWYAHNTPEFSWTLPAGAQEVRMIVSASPSSTPSVSYIPPIRTKKVDALSDGTYYFALRVRTSLGWSTVSRFTVNIDTASPESFAITQSTTQDTAIVFNTTDSGSGIEKYGVTVDDVTTFVNAGTVSEESPYVLSLQHPGVHTVTVTAFDKAGNTMDSSIDVVVRGIDAPTIHSFSESIHEGEHIQVVGATYPHTDVTLVLRLGDNTVAQGTVRSNAAGDFVYVFADALHYGTYMLTAYSTDSTGVSSTESKPNIVSIKNGWYTTTLGMLFRYFSIAFLVVLLAGGLVWVFVRVWFGIFGLIRRMRKEAREAEEVTEQAFAVLKKGVQRHITRLAQKKSTQRITAEELAFLEELQDTIEQAEKRVTKEVRDISHVHSA